MEELAQVAQQSLLGLAERLEGTTLVIAEARRSSRPVVGRIRYSKITIEEVIYWKVAP